MPASDSSNASGTRRLLLGTISAAALIVTVVAGLFAIFSRRTAWEIGGLFIYGLLLLGLISSLWRTSPAGRTRVALLAFVLLSLGTSIAAGAILDRFGSQPSEKASSPATVQTPGDLRVHVDSPIINSRVNQCYSAKGRAESVPSGHSLWLVVHSPPAPNLPNGLFFLAAPIDPGPDGVWQTDERALGGPNDGGKTFEFEVYLTDSDVGTFVKSIPGYDGLEFHSLPEAQFLLIKTVPIVRSKEAPSC